jgi:hypothetical protein
MTFGELLNRYEKSDSDDPARIPWAFPDVSSSKMYGYDLLKEVIRAVWEEKGELISKWKYYSDMEESVKTSAKVFQTKKNIPDYILKEMRESVFNKAFGYVEIDEDCDLDKIRAIAHEFTSFKERFIPGFDSSKVALRFRKLGRHKALGLYFPMLGCLCVDLRSPSSFIHELGHCIDYMHGGRHALSDRCEFYSVYTLYKRSLMGELYKDADKMAALSGSKSKYNLRYYLLHTESFARCFELYVTKCLKVDSSLCKQNNNMGWAYPENEELLQAIRVYFDRLLVTVNAPAEDELLSA